MDNESARSMLLLQLTALVVLRGYAASPGINGHRAALNGTLPLRVHTELRSPVWSKIQLLKSLLLHEGQRATHNLNSLSTSQLTSGSVEWLSATLEITATIHQS